MTVTSKNTARSVQEANPIDNREDSFQSAENDVDETQEAVDMEKSDEVSKEVLSTSQFSRVRVSRVESISSFQITNTQLLAEVEENLSKNKLRVSPWVMFELDSFVHLTT